MKRMLMGWMAAAALWGVGCAFAHHSFAMFEADKQVTLAGTVHEFQWTNPHAWIELDVPNKDGVLERWGVELNSPNNLTRQGWKSTLLKAGDKVSVTIKPLRSGEKGGLFVSVTLPDGKVVDDPTRRAAKPAPAAATDKP